MYGTLLPVQSYLPHSQFTHTHVHTYIRTQRILLLHALDSVCVQICPSPPAPKVHTYKDTSTHTHAFLHPEAHDSMAFPIVTCVSYVACLALFSHLQGTQPVRAAVVLGTSWFGPAAQFVGGAVLVT